MKLLREWTDKLMQYIYPPRCIFCDEVLPIKGKCKACSKTVASLRLKGDERTKEGMKDRALSKLDGVTASFEYAEEVAEAVIRFKFCDETGMAYEMSQFMAKDIQELLPVKDIDIVVGVPAYKCSDIHSRLLAKRVAAILDKKYDRKALVKLVPTRKQHELNRKEREINIKRAFDVKDKSRVEGKTVLICDDVMTSGNTINECARALKDAGAKSVYASAFSSTILPD